LFNQLLYFVTPFQEMRAVNAQLAGQMFGRYALGNAPQDQDDLNAAVTAATPNRVGEQVKHCPTLATAIVHNWSTMPVVGLLIGWQSMTSGTFQSLWMQYLEQIVIALLLIHQLVNREDQHRSPRFVTRCGLPSFYPFRCLLSRFHLEGFMSRTISSE
jgi:hypothetical protein